MTQPTATIVRSKKRKRTVALHVEPDGTLTVTAPLRTSLEWIQSFLREKAGWIARRQRAQALRRESPPLILQEGSLVPFRGEMLKIALGNGTQTEGSAGEDTLPLDLPKDLTPEALHAEIKTELALWYKKQARRLFPERATYWAGVMGLHPSRVIVTATSGRWGSCSVKNEVRLSWKLILMKPALLDYVIVHELAHIPHKNHGKRFWNLVTHTIPDMKERRQAVRIFEKSPFLALYQN